MVARARLLQARVLPHGWLDVLRQVSLFGAAYLAYRLVRGAGRGQTRTPPSQHARDLISLERTLHVFVEPSIQAWASGSHFLMVLSSWLYVNAQTTVTVAALVYLYLRHNRNFYFVRNMFMIAMAIALRRLHRVPDGAAALPAGVGLHRQRLGPDRRARVAHERRDERAGQPLRRGALDARGVRADDRLAARAPGALARRARAVAAVPVPDGLRDRGHRQPLHLRRVLGALTAGASAYGASWLARARPNAWRFSTVPGAGLTRAGSALEQHGPAQATHAVATHPARRGPLDGRARARAPIGAGERRELVRNRLIESRLTPNTISLTGFVLNVIAAVLVWERLFFLGGVAFIVGSIMDTLDGRYSRMSGKGTPFGAFLDSTLDRIEEGIVLTAVAGLLRAAGQPRRGRRRGRRRAGVADGQLHARPRRGARASSARSASPRAPCAW